MGSGRPALAPPNTDADQANADEGKVHRLEYVGTIPHELAFVARAPLRAGRRHPSGRTGCRRTWTKNPRPVWFFYSRIYQTPH